MSNHVPYLSRIFFDPQEVVVVLLLPRLGVIIMRRRTGSSRSRCRILLFKQVKLLEASELAFGRLLGRMIMERSANGVLGRLILGISLCHVNDTLSTLVLAVRAAPFDELHTSIRRRRIVETDTDYLILA